MVKNILVISFSIILLFTTQTQAATTIVVDWALDEEPQHNSHTCDYTQGAFFFPDTSGSGAGKCTFRRALRQAGAMADDSFCSGCAPITIVFNGLDGENGDGDDGQFNNNQWVLPIDGSSNNSFFGLKPQTGINSSGDILISGPTVNVQSGQMPKIIIDSPTTLDLQLDQITISNMGFMGGMSIHWKEAFGHFINNTWGLSPDGMSVEFGDVVGNTDNLAGNHAILGTQKATGMVIENNVLTGASTAAVEISSGTEQVQILNNWIGTRIDGSVPDVPDNLDCRTFTNINPVVPPLDAAEWFGGAGISAAGTGLNITGNVIAGMQTIHSTFSTPPGALRVLGALHTIESNIIGKDVTGNTVGVCGQGIQLSTQTNTTEPQNNGHMILDNEIHQARNGYENTTGAILWSDTTSNAFLDGGNTIRRNLVIDGPEKYFEVGPMLTTPIKIFEPAEITLIDGTMVTGGNDPSNFDDNESHCPGCIIDLYLDDGDEKEEALEHLGSVMADNNGDFTFTLDAPLPDGFGIRTTSTSTANNVIPHTWAGQTSEMSNEVYGLANDVIFKNGFEDNN